MRLGWRASSGPPRPENYEAGRVMPSSQLEVVSLSGMKTSTNEEGFYQRLGDRSQERNCATLAGHQKRTKSGEHEDSRYPPP